MISTYTSSLALPTRAVPVSQRPLAGSLCLASVERPRLFGTISAGQGTGVSTAAMTANAGARKNDATGGPAFEDPV